MPHTVPDRGPRLVLRDPARRLWQVFRQPCRVLRADRVEDVRPVMRELERCVDEQGLHAAGFIAYEAAPAFDTALPAKHDPGFPLVWFGLFEDVDEVTTLSSSPPDTAPVIDWRPSVTEDEYRARLRAIREYIGNGDTYQVNYSYRLRAETDTDPWRLFLAIAGDGSAPYAAFVDTGEWVLCSASPEVFLELDGDRVLSRPMKGTAARGLWFEDDDNRRRALRASEKDQAENVMIVDMVRNDLGRVAAVGSVEVPRLFEVEQYPTLWQMTSTVCARTHESLDAILAATFPPASITGAPKRRTMEIIAELESSPRRVYTGAIGVLSPGRRARFNVAIRTVLVHRASGRAEYGVGGGIVWDSTPAGEYAECATKARVLAHRPRDFDLLETLLWTGSGGYAYLSEHLRRLERSAAYFGFELDPVRVRRELDSLGRGLGIGPARVRLTVSPSGAVRAEARAWSTGSASGFGTVSLAAHAIDPSNVFLYHKTTNRQVYSEALQARPGSDDVLLWNSRGEVTESTVANVAVELDGVLCTPPLSSGLLPGTMRAWMLARGCLRERVLRVEDVLGDAPVYLFNSVRGMHRVQVRTNGSA